MSVPGYVIIIWHFNFLSLETWEQFLLKLQIIESPRLCTAFSFNCWCSQVALSGCCHQREGRCITDGRTLMFHVPRSVLWLHNLCTVKSILGINLLSLKPHCAAGCPLKVWDWISKGCWRVRFEIQGKYLSELHLALTILFTVFFFFFFFFLRFREL